MRTIIIVQANTHRIDRTNKLLDFSLVNMLHNILSGITTLCEPVSLRLGVTGLHRMGQCSKLFNAQCHFFCQFCLFFFYSYHCLHSHSSSFPLESLICYYPNYLTSVFIFVTMCDSSLCTFFSLIFSKCSGYIEKPNPRSCSCNVSHVGVGSQTAELG